MIDFGIMVEGQEDLTWERLFRLAQAAEDLGYESLFRSDHLTSLDGFAGRESLALEPSLAALAVKTRRIRFGPLVSPMTFRHPAVLAKVAASVDVLSGGRLEMGIGGGWNRGEHKMFGVPYPPFEERLDRLDEGAQVMKLLWSGKRASFDGKYYQLAEAESYPTPLQNPMPLILGGKNEKRTLRLVAMHATEWNVTYIGPEEFKRKSAVLDEHCVSLGRDPATLRRSLMTPFAVGATEAEAQERITAHREMFPGLPASLADWQAAGYIGGTPDQAVAQLKAFVKVGVTRVMLQHNDLDDLASLELIATDVLPQML